MKGREGRGGRGGRTGGREEEIESERYSLGVVVGRSFQDWNNPSSYNACLQRWVSQEGCIGWLKSEVREHTYILSLHLPLAFYKGFWTPVNWIFNSSFHRSLGISCGKAKQHPVMLQESKATPRSGPRHKTGPSCHSTAEHKANQKEEGIKSIARQLNYWPVAFRDGKNSSDFLSQIRSSNVLSSFFIKTFSWMQVFPQVSYEKKYSS